MRSLKAAVRKKIHDLAWCRARKRILCASQGFIQAGPFRGMKYTERDGWGGYYAKLMGTYEMELRQAVESLLRMPYDTLINAGAAEGYYAVGFAKFHPTLKRSIAFEAHRDYRGLMNRLAAFNGVEEKLTVLEFCSVRSLEEAMPATGRTLVIMDVEGQERDILDPALVPALLRADMLVELHDFGGPDSGGILEERFAATHDIKAFATRPRRLDDIPLEIPAWEKKFAENEYLELINEWRPKPMRWFFLQARGHR